VLQIKTNLHDGTKPISLVAGLTTPQAVVTKVWMQPCGQRYDHDSKVYGMIKNQNLKIKDKKSKSKTLITKSQSRSCKPVIRLAFRCLTAARAAMLT
jgi:hypothetical protein